MSWVRSCQLGVFLLSAWFIVGFIKLLFFTTSKDCQGLQDSALRGVFRAIDTNNAKSAIRSHGRVASSLADVDILIRGYWKQAP